MIKVIKEGIILQKTANEFENEGVLNPAAIRDGSLIHLFYRAVRQGNFSTIGYCRLSSPLVVEERSNQPLLSPEFDYECKGLEDPRIVKIEDLYYLSYTAYDGVNALGALAVSKDLIHFEKKGVIVPQITYEEFFHLTLKEKTGVQKELCYNEHARVMENGEIQPLIWDKNLIFFPRKIHNKLCFLHRIKPDIQILVAINSLEELTDAFWQDYFLHFSEKIVLSPKYAHESSYIGGGCPPIETMAGWLLIYHGVRDTKEGYIYSACAALLDLNDPTKEIARLSYPLFVPEFSWEKRGEVNNVCFPTGAVVLNDTLFIYYGAADEQIACASMSLTELIRELLQHTTTKDAN